MVASSSKTTSGVIKLPYVKGAGAGNVRESMVLDTWLGRKEDILAPGKGHLGTTILSSLKRSLIKLPDFLSLSIW